MTQIVRYRLRFAYAPAADWAAENPSLLPGEYGIESDTKKRKLGDGQTAWNDLAYETTAWGAITGVPADLLSLAGNAANGLWARTGAGTGAARTIAGTAGQITVTNGSGAGGNPTMSLANPLILTNAVYAGNTSYLASVGDNIHRLRLGHYDSSTVAFPTGLVAAQILAGTTVLDIATRDNAAAVINFRAGTGVTTRATIGSAAFNLAAGMAFQIGGVQVLGPRRTGWAAPTGTATRSTFATSTVTTAQLAERLKALLDDLTAHGVIGV
jgi:hypothetical protein